MEETWNVEPTVLEKETSDGRILGEVQAPGRGKHCRGASSIAVPPAFEQYDLDGDGRINKDDLLEILQRLRSEKNEKKVYRGISWLTGFLLLAVLGVNTALTYVVVNISKVVDVNGNRLVSTSSEQNSRSTITRGVLPVQTSEAMVTARVAGNMSYSQPAAPLLMSMKALSYTDDKGLHKHTVAGVSITGRKATIYSAVPGIMFEFTPRGLFIFDYGLPSSEGQGTGDGNSGRKLLSTTADCKQDYYEDESIDEHDNVFLEHMKVEECTSAGGIFTVITYSVLNEAGDWEVEDVDTWFKNGLAPDFFKNYDGVSTASQVASEPDKKTNR